MHEITQKEDLDDALAALLARLVRAKANREQRTVIEYIAMAIDASSVCVDCARETNCSAGLRTTWQAMRFRACSMTCASRTTVKQSMRQLDGCIPCHPFRLFPHHTHACHHCFSAVHARCKNRIRVCAANTDTRISESHLQLIARNAATILAARFPRLL